jgi:hypothetical protein
MVEAMARIAFSQPSAAVARTAPRSPMVPMANKRIVDPSYVTLAANYLSRIWVVGSAFAAALTQISTVVMPPEVAA